MKTINTMLLMGVTLLSAGAFMTSCVSSDDEAGLKSYPVTINISPADGLTIDNIENLTVVAKNSLYNITDTIDVKNGVATFNAVQGTYQFQVSGKVKDEATAYVTGQGSKNIYDKTDLSISVEKLKQSSLIFKTIYNAGCEMGYMKDGYFEIVNNSDEVQYLDGVIVFTCQSQTTENAWQASGITDLYPAGQGAVVAFPGSGKEHPLQPGESVLVANDAQNHKINSENENCPDLTHADWEIILEGPSSEIDNPAVPNLETIWTNNSNMAAFGLGLMGRGWILAHLPEGMTTAEYVKNHDYLQTQPETDSDMEFLLMPSKFVLDAVDIWNPNSNEQVGIFLPIDDAEGVLSSKIRSGKCQRRKVTKMENGRVYYQDTNNSANDFLTNQPLTPGETPTAVDE